MTLQSRGRNLNVCGHPEGIMLVRIGHLVIVLTSKSRDALDIQLFPSFLAPRSIFSQRHCCQSPCQQVAVDWLTAEMSHFLYLEVPFGRP